VEGSIKRVGIVSGLVVLLAGQAQAEECRRVTQPTTLAVMAHGGLWTRTADPGMTFRAGHCTMRIKGKVYCKVYPYSEPQVFIQHADRAGNEYTVVWGKRCR